jgi:putative redox protein
MIKATSKTKPYQVQFTNGKHSALADTIKDKGGGEAGFRPHELLEAALAACMNMTATMYASKHAIPLRQVVTKVSLHRSGDEQVVFKCVVELKGRLTAEQKEATLASARACPVRKTLLRGAKFAD